MEFLSALITLLPVEAQTFLMSYWVVILVSLLILVFEFFMGQTTLIKPNSTLAMVFDLVLKGLKWLSELQKKGPKSKNSTTVKLD